MKSTWILWALLNAGPSFAQHAAHQGEHGQTAQQSQHDHDGSQAASPHDNQLDAADGASQSEHVAPEPPQSELPPMTHRKMMELMQMDDTGQFGRLLIDQAEWYRDDARNLAAWDATAWYGGDYNKLLVRSDGEYSHGAVEAASAELLWDRVVARWWSLQAGVRRDFGVGPERSWAAFGVMGLAPYWFELEATFYAGEHGRTAARVKAEYELLFTQRLILAPELAANLYGQSDPQRSIGSGLSDIEFGVRLRYEIKREFAPYLGITWQRLFGGTAKLAGSQGRETSDAWLTAGFRIWF